MHELHEFGVRVLGDDVGRRQAVGVDGHGRHADDRREDDHADRDRHEFEDGYRYLEVADDVARLQGHGPPEAVEEAAEAGHGRASFGGVRHHVEDHAHVLWDPRGGLLAGVGEWDAGLPREAVDPFAQHGPGDAPVADGILGGPVWAKWSPEAVERVLLHVREGLQVHEQARERAVLVVAHVAREGRPEACQRANQLVARDET